MAERKDISTEPNYAAKVNKAGETKKPGEVVFVSRGDVTVKLKRGGYTTHVDAAGVTQQLKRPNMVAEFRNRTFTTSDQEVVDLIIGHQHFEIDFFFHPCSVPDDYKVKYGKEPAKDLADKFFDGWRAKMEDDKRAIENAAFHDRAAHPPDGVHDPDPSSQADGVII